MKLACLTYSKSGESVAQQIKRKLNHHVEIFTRRNFTGSPCQEVGRIFEEYEGLVFVCAAGIAVRVIVPYIKHKTLDPAVVVVDDLGRYVISLLSGHLGGANQLANEIAEGIGAQPIVTTASEGRGIESVDMFAQRYGLLIESMEDAKKITAMMVDGKRIKIISEGPKDIRYDNLAEEREDGLIFVTDRSPLTGKIHDGKPCCILRPKSLNLGVGCRKGKSGGEMIPIVKQILESHGLSFKSVKAVGTIDAKKEEQGLVELCHSLGCTFHTFSAEDIRKVQHQFEASPFVQSSVGVTSVAEPCAFLLGGKLIVKKTAVNGVTVAVAKEEYCG